MFNSEGYVLLGVISFFLIFIIAGISFVRERTNQTMERLMVTPVKRWQVVLGYTLGFGIFAILQSTILICFVKWVLRMTITGSLVAAVFIMILLSMAAVCIGAFCSIFANNEFQMMQFIPMVVVPQIFFSGLISLDTLPYHLGELAKIMPVYYACNALQKIIVKGAGVDRILTDVLALFLFIALFFLFNILALKKYRRI
jgi:ABC-2 type transport system permease protein